jgi:hypothetical protein
MKYLYYYLFFLFVVFLFAFINSRPSQEGFVPALKQTYRPYVRNAKLYGQKMYNKYVVPMTNSLRKNGIM